LAQHQQLTVLIGLLKVKLPQFKTKHNAVDAGLSLPLDVSHLEELLLDIHSRSSLSNNLSIATPTATVAMVD